MKYILLYCLSLVCGIGFVFAITEEDLYWQTIQENEARFSKFFELKYPRSTVGGSSSLSLELWKTTLPIGRIFLTTVIIIYQHNDNKIDMVQKIQSFLQKCEQSVYNPILKELCTDMSNYYLGREYLISPIVLKDVQGVVKTHKWLYRTMQFSEFNELYPLIDHPYLTIRREYGIGDYLFWIADGYHPWQEYTGYDAQINFDGMVVMKAGDTHRQEFATIDAGYPIFYNSNYPRAIGIKDWKLNIFLLDRNPESEDILQSLGYNFELQDDGTWKLTACFDYFAPEEAYKGSYLSYDNFLKADYTNYLTSPDDRTDLRGTIQELPLSSCNPAVKITTRLK